MKIEIENPIDTRKKKIGTALTIISLVIFAFLGMQGADSADRLTEAEELIVEAAESDIGDANISTYDPTTVENKIETARAKIDAAEDIEGESERIRYLRDSADLVMSLNSMMSNIKEVLSSLKSSESYTSSDRFDEALSEINTAQNRIEAAQGNLNQFNNHFQDIQNSDYEAEELAQSNFRDSVSYIEDLLEYMDAYVGAYETMVRGLENLDSANTYLDQDEYNRAGNYYLDAKQNFQEAEESFKSIEDSAPSEYKSTVIRFTCRSGKLTELSEKSYQLTQAIEDGNQEKVQQLNEEIQEIDIESCN